jgi:hypothetical protein
MAIYPSPRFQQVYLEEEPTTGEQAATKSYVDGRAAVGFTKSLQLATAATVGAEDKGILYAGPPFNMLIMQLDAAIIGVDPNIILELYDGDPDAAGVLRYQATGLTMAEYSDPVSFYIPMPGNLYARIENIDAVAATVNIDILYVGIG